MTYGCLVGENNNRFWVKHKSETFIRVAAKKADDGKEIPNGFFSALFGNTTFKHFDKKNQS